MQYKSYLSELSNKMRIFCLSIFILSICFQKWEPFGSPYANATFLCFFIYLFFCILNFKESFSLKYIKQYLFLIVSLFLLMLIMNYVNYERYSTNVYSELRQLFMQIIFFWVFYNELISNKGLLNKVLSRFVNSVTILSLFVILGFGVDYVSGRLIILGENPNAIAFWLVVALLIIIKETREKNTGLIGKCLSMILLILFSFVIIKTGSRGALVILAVGLFSYFGTYFLFSKKRLLIKIPVISCALAIGMFGLYTIFKADIMQERFLEELDKRDYGGRLQIWGASLEIFKSDPIFGVGPARYEREIASTFLDYKDVHNEYLKVLCYSGIVGGLLFLAFLSILIKGSYRYIRAGNSPLSLTYMLMLTVFLFKSGGALHTFALWFLFAYIAASTNLITSQRINQS